MGIDLKKKLQVNAAFVSMRVILFAFLLLSSIFFSVLADRTVPVMAQTFTTPIFDDFDGSAIDTSKWMVQQNVNGGSGGAITVADSYISLTSNGTSFPLICTTTNPFPESGDFAVEFDIQYTRMTTLGNGFWVTKGPFNITEDRTSAYANILQVWADIGAHDGVLAFLLGKQVYNEAFQNNLYRTEQNNTLTFRLQYSKDVYTLYLNGEIIAAEKSTLRADTIGFGHPPAFYLPGTLSLQWTSFRINSIRMPQPSALSISATPSPATDSENKVSISGKLTERQGTGLPSASVLLSYQVAGMSTWNPITSTITDVNGAYEATWFAAATGNFLLKAEWRGDEKHVGTYETTNVSVTRGEGETSFLVESNSTLSALAFNSTSKDISFTASGPSGTTGFVRFVVSKTLMENLTDFRVYLDGHQVQFTVTSEAQTYVLFFQYNHSAHTVLVKMLTSVSPIHPDIVELPASTDLSPLIGGFAVVIVTVLIGVIIAKRRGNIRKIVPK